jgi:hypothetical protein
VGTRRARDEDCYNKVLGPYGIDKRNQKGKHLLNFLAVNKLKLMNSFFTNSFYSTWSDIKTRDPHMLDVWSTNDQKSFKATTTEPKTPGVPWCYSLMFPGVSLYFLVWEAISVVFPHVQEKMCWEIITCNKGISRMTSEGNTFERLIT